MKKFKINIKIFFLIILLILFCFYIYFSQNKFNSIQALFNTNKIEENINYYAIISVNVDSNSNHYIFNIPMICEAWRRVNYEPIILLVYSINKLNISKSSLKTIDYLNKLNVKIIEIKAPSNNEVIISMLARLFIGLFDMINNNDFVITTDSDLYPIRKEYYHVKNNDSIMLWNAYCCGTFQYNNINYQMYPIGHIGMRKSKWIQLMNLQSFESIPFKFLNISDIIFNKISELFPLDKYVKKNSEIVKGDHVWYLDQTLISIKLRNFIDSNSSIYVNKISYYGTRLDRVMSDSTWINLVDNNFHKLTDCHTFQSNILNKYHLLQKLFKRLFDEKKYQVFEEYFSEYSKLNKS